MEETKWLKPSISVSRIGDSTSVHAATRVNAEQALPREVLVAGIDRLELAAVDRNARLRQQTHQAA
jgi:hypothetical protein